MRAFLNAATAAFFFSGAALGLWIIYFQISDAVFCSTQPECSLPDYYLIFQFFGSALLLIIFFGGLGARVVWGMFHGE
jgi:hypothetical protein